MEDPLPIIMVGAAIDGHKVPFDLSAIASVEVVASVDVTDPVRVERELNEHPGAGLVVTGDDPRAAIDLALAMLRPILVASPPGQWCDDADALIERLATTATAAGWLPARFDPDCAAIDAAQESGQIGRPVAMRVVRTCAPGLARQQGCDLTGVIDLAVRWARSEVEHVASLVPADSTGDSTTACVTIAFASGATALVEAGSTATFGVAGFRETMLIGTTGALELPWDPTASLLLTSEGLTRIDQQTATTATSGPRRVVDEWVAAIQQSCRVAVTAADYVRACHLAWAAQRSAASNGQVVPRPAPTPPAP